jgi:hypothetical protein
VTCLHVAFKLVCLISSHLFILCSQCYLCQKFVVLSAIFDLCLSNFCHSCQTFYEDIMLFTLWYVFDNYIYLGQPFYCVKHFTVCHQFFCGCHFMLSQSFPSCVSAIFLCISHFMMCQTFLYCGSHFRLSQSFSSCLSAILCHGSHFMLSKSFPCVSAILFSISYFMLCQSFCFLSVILVILSQPYYMWQPF